MTFTFATCSFHEYRQHMGAPIRTSNGTPKWFRQQMPHWESVTPRRWTLDWEYGQFRDSYMQMLAGHGPDQLLREADQLATVTGADTLVLLCFETLYKPGAWCHRTLLSEYLHEVTGQPIRELGRIEQDQPTLF